MTTLEIIASVLTGGISTVGAWQIAKRKWRGRERVAEIQRDGDVSPKLIRMIEELKRDQRAADQRCRDELAAQRERCHEEIRERDTRIDDLEGRITTMAQTMASLGHRAKRDEWDEITGLHEVEAIARRTPTPLPPPRGRDE